MDTRLSTFKHLVQYITNGDTREIVNKNNDLFCLFLSQLVYFSDAFIEKTLINLGVTNYSIIKTKAPTTLCVTFDDVVYISIKGVSAKIKTDWLIILNFLANPYLNVAAHRGFGKTINTLIPLVRLYTALEGDKPVVLTGHSMGGALAILSSLTLHGCKVVTFGSPKLVTSVDAFEGIPIRNYKITCDLITHLPPFMYTLPGETVSITQQFDWRNPLNNHKLFSYCAFILPMLVEPSLQN